MCKETDCAGVKGGMGVWKNVFWKKIVHINGTE